MSGDGGPLASAIGIAVRAVSIEMADVLAYLEQRRENADTIAQRDPAFCDWAHDRKAQIEVILGDLRAGLHIGRAEVRAQLLAARAELSA